MSSAPPERAGPVPPGPPAPARPLVKICGIARAADAELAARAGADYLGAILSPGFGRSVDPAHAAAHRAAAVRGRAAAAAEGRAPGGPPASPALVGVFVDPTEAEVRAAAPAADLDVVQLHGRESPELVRSLRDAGPWAIWKAVRIAGPEDVLAAVDRWAGLVDGLLVDGGRPGESSGGRGERFAWSAVAEVRAALPPALLFVAAGGLDPENVAEAVARLSPDVVDVSSGVEETPGRKDPDRVRAFVRNARGGGGWPAPGPPSAGAPGRAPSNVASSSQEDA